MNGFAALPLVVLVVSALIGAPRLQRLRPATGARYSAVLLGAVVAAAVPTLWLLGLGGLAHVGVRVPLLDWCRHLLPQDRLVGSVMGLAALAAAVAGTARAARVLRLHRRLRCTTSCGFQMIDTDEVFAYTLPGPAATITVSRGLQHHLTADEFDLVIAHEQAHAQHRHDRLLLLALLARAFAPVVGSVSRRLEFQLERWADEEALEHTGADRALGAQTIAKVALAGTSPAAVLGITSQDTVARAAALLEPPTTPSIMSNAQGLAIVAAIVTTAAVQLHHTAVFAASLMWSFDGAPF